jgi:GAF domain-containing protein
MKSNNKHILIFSNDRGMISKVTTVLEKKFLPENNNTIRNACNLQEAKNWLKQHYNTRKFFNIMILDLKTPPTTKNDFFDMVNGMQYGHEWVLLGNGTGLRKEDESFIEKNNIYLVPMINEYALFSMLDSILEKKFNQKKYNLINRIDEIINLGIETKEILSRIVNVTLEYLGLKICWISLVNYENNNLEIGALTGFGIYEEPYKKEFNITLSESSVTTECINQKKQIQYEDVQAESCPFKYKRWAEIIGLKSILITPVFGKAKDDLKKVIATLNLYTNFPHKFKEDELELAHVITEKMASILSIKGQYDEEQDETRRKIELIEKVAAEINKNVKDYKKVFQTIVDEGIKLVNADRGCIKVCYEDVIAREHHRGCRSVRCRYEKYRYPDITNHIIREKESILIEDINKFPYKDPKIKYRGVKSRISVPLMLEDEVIGVLTVEHREKDYFNSRHLQLFEALAKHAVIAIQNTKQYKKIQKQLRSQLVIKKLIEETSKLEAIENEESRNKYRKEKLNSVIEWVVKETGKLFDAEPGFVALANLTDNYARIDPRWRFGLEKYDLPALEIGVVENEKVIFKGEKSITGKVIAEGKIYKCDVVEGNEFYFSYGMGDPTKSEIVLPLKFQNQTFGVFALGAAEEYGFSKEDEEILESIATQMALLIRRFSYLNTLLDLNKPFRKIDNLEQIYDEILVRTLEIMGTKVGYIRVLDRNHLVIKGSKGLEEPDEHKIGLYLQIGDGISGKVAETLTPISISNVQAPSSGYKYKEFAQKNNLFAMISVPIFSIGHEGKKDLIGVINTYANRICDFSSLDLQLMLSLADKAGEAIKKAKLINQLNAIATIDEELTTTTEKKVIRSIADIAKNLLDADHVVLYQYNADQIENLGFSIPATVSGKFKYDEFKFQSNFTIDSFVVQLIQEKSEEFFINSYDKSDLIRTLYKKRKNGPLHQPFYKREDLKSVIILKLTYQKELVGILFINYKYAKSFSSEEKRIARTFANKAAIAISNIRKYEDINRLHEIGNVIATESNLKKEVLKKIASNAMAALNADIIIVYRYDQKTRKPFPDPIHFGNIYEPNGILSEQYSEKNVISNLIKNNRDVFATDVKRSKILSSRDKRVEHSSRMIGFTDREMIKSCAAILLKVRRELVGIMFINYRRPQKFNQQQKRIIKIFANHAAIAIRNANLIEESDQTVQRIRSNLTAIQFSGYQIVKNLNKVNISEKDVLTPILKKVLELIHVDMGYISVVDKEERCVRILVCSPQYKVLQNEPIDIYYPEKVWIKDRKRYSIFSEDPLNKTDYVRFVEMPHIIRNYPRVKFTGDKDVMSALRVPIYSAEELLGMIVLESKKVNAFSKIDAYTVVSLANQASMALQNYKLIHQLRRIGQIDTVILKEQNSLDKVLHIILEVALELVKKKYADIKLWIDNKFIIKKSIPPTAENKIINVKKSISGIAVETKRTFYEKNVLENPRFLETVGVDTKSELVIPLMEQKELIGVLNIESEEFDNFTKEDIKILEILAGQAAIAIVNAKNYDDAQMAKKTLENSINKEILVGFTQMNSIFEHKISNSVGLIRLSAIDLLERKNEFKPDIVETLYLIKKRAETALMAPNEATIKANQLLFAERQKIDLSELFERLKYEDIINLSHGAGIDLSIECMDNLPYVEANYDLLYDGVFVELILNAVKAMPDGGKITIEVKAVKGASRQKNLKWQNIPYLEIKVSDSGCGIPKGHEEKIFEPKTSFWKDKKGSGKGLFYLKSIITSLGGDVQSVTKNDKGAMFIMKLPISK